MKILLSPHLDTVVYPFKFEYSFGIHKGLLDNTIGVLATYLAIYGNQSILKKASKGEIGVWHNWNEEFGMLENETELDSEATIIIVDVASGDKYKGLDFAIENVGFIGEKEMRQLYENLKWEGYKLTYKMYNGDEEDEDEAWKWLDRGFRVLSFTIPIKSPKGNWHSEESTITHRRLKKAVQGLQRLICYLS